MNIGANGTFVQEQQIDKERIHNGMVIRLAATGPKLQILIDGAESLTPSSSEASSKSPNPEKLSDGRPTFMAHK
jgi:pSer/pThr/pTyr-binding forkhead associated (FHA) protein